MEKVDITIIGAGVIGLAVASEMSENFDSVFVLEKHNTFGQETSSRNSEVIHSGIYYPKNSLKAISCVEGARLLYEICDRNKIPYKKTGKIIVATTNSELSVLEELFERGKENGVKGLRLLTRKETNEMESNIKTIGSLYSPDTGIIDSHSLMKYFLLKAVRNRVEVVYNSEVIDTEKCSSGYKIMIKDADGEKFIFLTNILINCAGLESDTIAKMVGINTEKLRYVLNYCKGQYFNVNGEKKNFIQRLIYPVPKPHSGGLGIHATINLAGIIRLGPDDNYIKKEEANYNVNIKDKEKFYYSVKKFLPFLELSDLQPDTSGIRPKLQTPGEDFRDFVIREESDLGFPGFINLIGIESPGLTSVPYIAKYVKNLINHY